MKPALFNVLCEIKEKTGEFCFLYFLLSAGFLSPRLVDEMVVCYFYGLSSLSITLCFFYFSQPLRKECRFIRTKRRSLWCPPPPSLFPFNDLWLPDGSLADKRYTPCMWTPLAPDEVLSLGWSVFMPTFGPFQGAGLFSPLSVCFPWPEKRAVLKTPRQVRGIFLFMFATRGSKSWKGMCELLLCFNGRLKQKRGSHDESLRMFSEGGGGAPSKQAAFFFVRRGGNKTKDPI